MLCSVSPSPAGQRRRRTGTRPPHTRISEPDPVLLATRQQTYRTLVMGAVDLTDVEAIRRHLQRQHAYGSDRFRTAIEAQLGRSVGPQKIGRPKKAKENGNQVSATESHSLSLPGL